jgi:hypothetical protein
MQTTNNHMQNSDNYKIVYSNHFEFHGHILAFRKGLLFEISGVSPLYLPIKEDNGCQGWYLNFNRQRKWLGKEAAKELAKERIPITVDVSDLQWCTQIELDECFNLNN